MDALRTYAKKQVERLRGWGRYRWLPLAVVVLLPLIAIALAVPALEATQPEQPQGDLPLPPRPPDDLPPAPALPEEPADPALPEEPAQPADEGGSHGGGSLRRDVDLTVQQYASKDQVRVGDQIEFTITVTYADGERPAENVLIFEEIPTFLDIGHAATSWGQLSIQNNQISVFIPQLYPGDVVTVYVLAYVNDQPAPDFMTVIASVETTTEDSGPWNDLAAVPVIMLQ